MESRRWSQLACPELLTAEEVVQARPWAKAGEGAADPAPEGGGGQGGGPGPLTTHALEI